MKLRHPNIFLGLLLAVIAVAALPAGLSALTIKGIVRDSLTLQGIPYASLRVPGTTASAVADSRGLFEFTLPPPASAVTASSQAMPQRP